LIVLGFSAVNDVRVTIARRPLFLFLILTALPVPLLSALAVLIKARFEKEEDKAE
jgi:hypothetical protein